MENKEVQWKTPLLIGLAVVTVLAIIYGILINFTSILPGFHAGKTVEETVTLDGKLDKVKLDLDLANVEIAYGNELSVYYNYPEKMVPSITLQNGVLDIHSNKRMKAKNGIIDDYKIIITFPQDIMLEAFELDLDCGNVEVPNLIVKDITVDADLGNIEFENIQADTFTVDADCGNVEIKNSEFKSVKADADLGNIEFTDVKFESGNFNADMGNIEVSGDYPKITAKCAMGSVEIKTDRPEKEVDMDLDADMGSITVNGKSR